MRWEEQHHDVRGRPRPGEPGRVRDRPGGGLQRRRARGDHHDHGLELRAPLGGSATALRGRLPALLVYILSFTFIGIYWNNHHHLLRAARRVTGGVMWSNLHLLFWLSLIPVLTEWISEDYKDTAPAVAYGVVCLGAAAAFTILTLAIVRAD